MRADIGLVVCASVVIATCLFSGLRELLGSPGPHYVVLAWAPLAYVGGYLWNRAIRGSPQPDPDHQASGE
jgi:hypothetical protein